MGRPRQRAIDVTATIVATRRRENTILTAVAKVEVAATVGACPWCVLALNKLLRTATFAVEQHDVAGSTPLPLLLPVTQSGNRSCARIR